MTEPESGKKYCLYSFKAVDDGSGYHIQDGGEIDSRKRELQGGEVLISRLNPRINRVQRVSDEHEYTPIASSEFVVIEQSEIDSEYLYHYLKSPYIYHRLTNHVTGSTGSRSRVGFDFVMDSPIPVPPSEEQRRIVEQVESVDMNRVHRAVEDVVDLFDEYRDSVLSYAFKKSPINKGKLSDERVMTAEKSISE
jgi:type I restriction enzyme S subunit